MQPYKRGGRFYNHKDDSILRRLKNFSKSFFFVIRYHVWSYGKKRSNAYSIGLKNSWITFMPQIAHSVDPLITWLGHSTFLIQIAGVNIITDPMLFNGFPIFSRLMPFPVALNKLPKIDIVLISHNHKDHLDSKSLNFLRRHKPLFLVPVGNKGWFDWRKYENVTEKTWGESEQICAHDGNTTLPMIITFLPSVHWASRGLLDINKTLWGSWLIDVGGYKIYFAGDTAYGEHFSAIARRFGRIDLALMPIGPNEPREFLAEAHVNSDEAVRAFIDLKARHFIPMHWGTFGRMGAERNDDPIGQLKAAWEKYNRDLSGAELHIVKCGEPRKFGL